MMNVNKFLNIVVLLIFIQHLTAQEIIERKSAIWNNEAECTSVIEKENEFIFYCNGFDTISLVKKNNKVYGSNIYNIFNRFFKFTPPASKQQSNIKESVYNVEFDHKCNGSLEFKSKELNKKIRFKKIKDNIKWDSLVIEVFPEHKRKLLDSLLYLENYKFKEFRFSFLKQKTVFSSGENQNIDIFCFKHLKGYNCLTDQVADDKIFLLLIYDSNRLIKKIIVKDIPYYVRRKLENK
ncbi:MAG: hypothetical protein IPH57_13465 [Saprospiraceae bacterium]|nr:hypothetical protein [Saprospiraceae bacterium]